MGTDFGSGEAGQGRATGVGGAGGGIGTTVIEQEKRGENLKII